MVLAGVSDKEEEWVITEIERRKNYVIRQSPKKKGHDHLLASNVDQGVLICYLKTTENLGGLYR